MFWRCFWKNIDVDVFDDVLQNIKHRANDASNDVNRPPLPQGPCSPCSTLWLVESFAQNDMFYKIRIAKSFVLVPCFHVKDARFVCKNTVCQHLIQVHLRQQMVYLEIRTLYEKPLISQIISNVNHIVNNIVLCMYVICSQIK